MSDIKLSKQLLKTVRTITICNKVKLTTSNGLSSSFLTWFTLITPSPLTLRQTDTLSRNVVTNCSCQCAQSVAVAMLAAEEVVPAEVVRMKHALTAPKASYTSFARTLSCGFVTKHRAIYCTCLIAATWQTDKGMICLHFVVAIQAFVALSSSDIGFTGTLPCLRIAHSCGKRPRDVTFTSLTTRYIQPVEVVHAGVTVKPFHSFFTTALPGERVAELVH